MSRIAKWKLEKAKVKVVFRLQFNATHIAQSGWDKLFISFIPADSGKATAKTTKATVRNGTCKWADPIYETTKLFQDSQTKRYDEKFYKLVVAMGSSRSSILGEANINLADYADAYKPYVVSLPLQGTDSGTILHVTVQILTSKTGFREFEQQREVRERRLHATHEKSLDDYTGGKVLSSEETLSDQMDKANVKVRFKSESRERTSHEEEAGLNEDYTDSAVGFDGSSNTSESLYAEKHEASSTHEIESTKSTISGDLGGHSLSQSSQPEKGDPSDHQSHGWASDYSMDNDLALAYEETSRLRGCLEVAESSISELKMEVSSLQSHANEIGVETVKFSEQIAAEVASGEELAKEVSLLKSECLKFKDDLEQLTNSKLDIQLSSGETNSMNSHHLSQDLQLRWLKGLLVVEDKLRELQNKACFGIHERDFGFLNSEFEALIGVLQDLKQGTGETMSDLTILMSERAKVKEIRQMGLYESENFVSRTEFGADSNQAESIAHCLSISSLVSRGPDSKDGTNSLEGKFFELLRELDQSKAEQETLMRKMDQMECYYEALIQELEENHKQMLGELQNLRNEHSTCHYTISSAKAQMETMHQDMNEQISRFAEDKQELESVNKELEKRATTTEAALKRARLNYSIAVNQLQKDLELLSFQVSSMFETNESLIRQTYGEASRHCFQGHSGLSESQNPDTELSDTGKILKFENRNAEMKKIQSLGGDILLEDLKKSLHLQEELYQKVEEEICEMHVVNMHLDVFSKTLEESLLEAVVNIGLKKERIFELTQQLEISKKSEELLMQRLQNAMDDVYSLNEYNGSCIARYNEVTLQNQNLEAKLGSVSRENCLLKQKITELEAVVEEYRNYDSKFQSCIAEKIELENLLNQESRENGTLRNEISSLEEEIKAFQIKFKELDYAKDNFQKILNFLQDKLGNLLASYDDKIGQSPWSKSLSLDMELKDFIGVVSRLELLQNSANGKILQLMEEKKDLEEKRDVAQASLKARKSEILMIKQKFEHDIHDMVNKLNASNTLVQELQLEVEAVANKLNARSEAEEKYVQQNSQLFSDLARLEVVLEQITSKNEDLLGKISALETINEDLRRSKLTIAEFTQQNQDLAASLQDKTEESVELALELNNLKENLKGLQDELHVDRESRKKLEGLVAELSHKLNEKHDQLLKFDHQKVELVHLKQLASDLELKKSKACHLLMDCEDHLQKVHQETSSVTHMESQLSKMHELLIAADVEVIFTRLQYKACFKELVEKIQSSDEQVKILHIELFDVENRLSQCLVSEKQYTEENAKLLTILESMKLDSDACVSQNRVLLDLNNTTVAEVEEYKNQAAALEVSLLKDRNQHIFEVEQLKLMVASSEEEIENLVISQVEHETKGIVLEVKLDELRAQLTFTEENNKKLVLMQDQCNELTRKLSEQIMKTEEFKNLSIHLKELKDKADAACEAHGKRESEAPSVAMQESLRIAFIREQYETKLQELKHQLSISKKHGEEMLWKLQDAANEIENRKKSEASHFKKNEEMSLKILELEAEIHSVLSDKLEISMAYDRLKDEMECSLITLECSKEERQMLETSLQECNEEKSKITDELRHMKELLAVSSSPMNVQNEGTDGSQEVEFMSRDLVTREVHGENPISAILNQKIVTRDMFSENGSTRNMCEGDECSIAKGGEGHLNALISMQSMQGVNGIPKLAAVDQGNSPHRDAKHLAVINDHFKAQNLKSSMEHLHKELERMIIENSLSTEDTQIDPNFQGLQRELMQLRKANEELANIFPLFKEFPVNGNSLERVLALEIELAEALQSKNKPSIQFQSSFLKQHSDEAAIFQSFRDINELIKDMLEIKRRNATVENELKEMHDRYSQLSLQFAEVEGERQKLMMTLKNARASKIPFH